MFKGHCFPKEIILQAVYYKLRFSLSYWDIEELLSIRGVKVDHATNGKPTLIRKYVIYNSGWVTPANLCRQQNNKVQTSHSSS